MMENKSNFFDMGNIKADKTWRIVRWWRQWTGRSIVKHSCDRGADYTTSVTWEYDTVTGVYTVLKVEQHDNEA